MSVSPRLPKLLLALALAAGAVAPVSAQWMWRDKNGQVHASDLPPPREVPDKDVLKRPPSRIRAPAAAPAAAAAASAAASAAAAASAPAEARARVDPELEARRRLAEQEQAAQRRQQEERIALLRAENCRRAQEQRIALLRAENCRRAQEQLRALDSGIRISRVNERGEPEVLDDEARAAETRRARGIIASDCR